MHEANRALPVGVLDSGVGGVSVLREMARLMPSEHFLYYGDQANTPYGTRAEGEIRVLAFAAVEQLRARAIKALVVACNTITSAAITEIRARYDMPVVGMEPALKPASGLRVNGKVLVLATPATLRQAKFLQLYEQYGQHALALPCPGLMEFAERGEFEGEGIDRFLRALLHPVQDAKVDAVVLGCTHYVFLKKAIAAVLPGAQLIDGNLGTARRLQFLLSEADLLSLSGEGEVEFLTSGDPKTVLPRMKELFEME